MLSLYDFKDVILKMGFKINLDSHYNNHAKSILSITPFFTNFGIETRSVIKIFKTIAYHSRLIKKSIQI